MTVGRVMSFVLSHNDVYIHNDSGFDLQRPYKSHTIVTVSRRLCCWSVHICSDANVCIGNIICGLKFIQFSSPFHLSSEQKEKINNIFVH